MLKFTRNKMVSIRRKDQDTISIHGILDDFIYSLELKVDVKISNLEILSIDGQWNRYTTPGCPRATPFVKEAVGFHIEEGVDQKIHKIVGRKACRHYANLLIECCDSAIEAVKIIKWEDKKAERADLSFEQFVSSIPSDVPQPEQHIRSVSITEKTGQAEKTADLSVEKNVEGGIVIDLHVHTYPASPCSSVGVDQLIEEAKKIGLDAICLTDHNFVWNPRKVEDLRQKHGFLILRGNEITTNQGDMLVFGLEKEINGIIRLEDLKEEVLNAGGFIIVAHPFRGFLVFGVGELGLTTEKARERALFKYVDAVEVLNSKVTENENKFAAEVANSLGLPVTGGSDAHEVTEVGIYGTRFSDIIRNEKDLIGALQNGHYSPIAYRKERDSRF